MIGYNPTSVNVDLEEGIVTIEIIDEQDQSGRLIVEGLDSENKEEIVFTVEFDKAAEETVATNDDATTVETAIVVEKTEEKTTDKTDDVII